MTPLYLLVATTMERLGIQPIRAEEIERRAPSQGRRSSDSGWQFLQDHLILTAIEVCAFTLAYSIYLGGQ